MTQTVYPPFMADSDPIQQILDAAFSGTLISHPAPTQTVERCANLACRKKLAPGEGVERMLRNRAANDLLCADCAADKNEVPFCGDCGEPCKVDPASKFYLASSACCGEEVYADRALTRKLED